MTGRSYEAYLFDLDGTLVDTVPDIDQALNHALATVCLLYTSPSPRDKSSSRMPSSA